MYYCVANACGWIGKDPNTEYHYVWIKNISRLLFKNNKHNGTVFVCRNCLNVCSSRDVYERHIKICLQLNKSSHRMCFPLKEVNDSIQFKKFAATVSYPFAIAADSETRQTKPIQITNSYEIPNEHKLVS